ncbi:hypothetical protein ETAA8_06830 [Anatilimnocola aggregata]|uniref:Putative restriction endonuclease domain-containing protein n=1 Tax=Anatilimnocola aggregata TaxID=2528021 RepID=A0A517Y5U8_9BACT|nr:Uma2 family endonuclease [Anatilimnocola aggregata]QDU25613.1 hypothetical protein ETAA8_06830 [Anatilimnocola aggregata]
MPTVSSTSAKLLTMGEFIAIPAGSMPFELVLGRAVEMNVPAPTHGKCCSNISRAMGRYLDQYDLGHLTSEAGVITHRDPDSIRPPDVAFFSYAKMPRGDLPEGYWPVSPELVFEVRSQYDRWVEIVAKVGEFLSAGILVVAVLDPQERKLHVYSADRPTQILAEADVFQVTEFLPDILPNCTLAVRDFLK